MDKFYRRFKPETGIVLVELMLGLLTFAILAPGMVLLLHKGMEAFFFERDELWVQKDMRSVIDKVSDDLRKASSIDVATPTDVSFNGSSKRYYLSGENIYDIDGGQVNSSEVKVVELSFSYYGSDINTSLPSPVEDVSQVKAVGITMRFQMSDNPVLALESWVLMRNLL